MNLLIQILLIFLAFLIFAVTLNVSGKFESKAKAGIITLGIALVVVILEIVGPFMIGVKDEILIWSQDRSVKSQTVIAAKDAGKVVNAIAGSHRHYATIETTTGIYRTDGFSSLTKGKDMYVQTRADESEFLCDAPAAGDCSQIRR